MRLFRAGSALMLALGMTAAWSPAEAKQRAGFAKLDQQAVPGMSVMCGARRGDPTGPNGNTFTYHVTLKNAGPDTDVIVKYQDGTNVSFPIAAGAVLHFSGVGGSTNGLDRVIEVTGPDLNSRLVGTISALFDTGAQESPNVPGTGLCAAVAPAQ